MALIDNPFAIAIVFYFNYRREKLSADFLNKLIKKYGSSPQKSASMLLELKKKYDHHVIATSVTINEILRVLYYIDNNPSKYFSLVTSSTFVIPLITIDSYHPEYDCFNSSFNAEKVVLQTQNKTNRLISIYSLNDPLIKSYDNMSKVKCIVPGFQFTPIVNHNVNTPLESTHVSTTSTSSSTTPSYDSSLSLSSRKRSLKEDTNIAAVNTSQVSKKIHILHRIAQDSVSSTPALLSSKNNTKCTNEAKNNNSIYSSGSSGNTNTSPTVMNSQAAAADGLRIESAEGSSLVQSQCASVSASPLSLLYDLMKQKTRCKILVRRHPKVTSVLIGYLRAFDRHFNCLLTDVEETIRYAKTKGTNTNINSGNTGNEQQSSSGSGNSSSSGDSGSGNSSSGGSGSGNSSSSGSGSGSSRDRDTDIQCVSVKIDSPRSSEVLSGAPPPPPHHHQQQQQQQQQEHEYEHEHEHDALLLTEASDTNQHTQVYQPPPPLRQQTRKKMMMMIRVKETKRYLPQILLRGDAVVWVAKL